MSLEFDKIFLNCAEQEIEIFAWIHRAIVVGRKKLKCTSLAHRFHVSLGPEQGGKIKRQRRPESCSRFNEFLVARKMNYTKYMK